MTFTQLGLSPDLGEVIEKLGYVMPTPIQNEAIPAILQGRDLLACAETGTGKTAAFLLPIIDMMRHSRLRQGLPVMLVIVPTRELATQVMENFRSYTDINDNKRSLTAITLVGGEVLSSQERLLKKGVDAIIATPGRLIDLLERGTIICNHVQAVILDEADRMLDMGFMADVDKILAALPKLRQTLLFSATIDKRIQEISKKYQLNPKEITVSRSAKTSDLIDQFIIKLRDDERERTLKFLLSRDYTSQTTVVFCNRKSDIDDLTRQLAKKGIGAEALHGDLSQRQRNETLDRFRKGLFRVLVTSDVAARGIDVTGIGVVINFNLPINAEDYVHRIGRTGRAGHKGIAISFVVKGDMKKLERIQKLTKQQIKVMDFHFPVEEEKQQPKQAMKENASCVQDHASRRGARKTDGAGEEIDGKVIGFGKNVPAFMLNDPLKAFETMEKMIGKVLGNKKKEKREKKVLTRGGVDVS